MKVFHPDSLKCSWRRRRSLLYSTSEVSTCVRSWLGHMNSHEMVLGFQSAHPLCMKALGFSYTAPRMAVDARKTCRITAARQIHGPISLSPSPESLEGSGQGRLQRQTSRRPKTVVAQPGDGVARDVPSLPEQQKALTKSIKSHGQRGDWCRALEALR